MIRGNAQRRCILEQTHHLGVIQRNLGGLDSRQILEHTNHGRIIVSQNIQFQQVVVDGVIVKMGGDGVRGHIIRRMLHRGKGVNVLSHRQNNDTAGVLTGTSPDSGTPCDNPVDFAGSLVDAPLLKIIFHIPKGSLVRQGCNGSRTEGLSVAENNLRVLMGFTLVLTGEVQVNIRLLISLKSQEGFKRNIKALLGQRMSAHRAVLIRHITSGTATVFFYLRRVKVIVVAVGAHIVGA